MFNIFLKIPWLRQKLAFELRHFHFHAVHVEVPIGQGLKCPILHPDYWHSFQEILIGHEYTPIFDHIPAPTRWLDVGCHAGFFSLWMELERRRRGINGEPSALLVDADSRVQKSVDLICRINGLNFEFMHRAIGKGDELRFEEKEVMSSAAGPGGKPVKVARADEFRGRFDLVKVDIEGAELDFLQNYKDILKRSRHLVLEWHSWSDALSEIRNAAYGFREVAEIAPARDIGGGRSCGVILFEHDGN